MHICILDDLRHDLDGLDGPAAVNYENILACIIAT